MKASHCCLVLLCLAAVVGFPSSAEAQQHRATNLGNPATRFADPLTTPDDLRARFADMTLWPDIASILRQWGWTGDMDDLLHAAATAEIHDAPLAPGTRMPFMSSRKNGQPVTLKDVEWAGREPAPAFAFEFASKGRRYRCVTPKACSNFFLEDLGAPELKLQCATPDEVPTGRPVFVCLTVRNTGDGTEPEPVVTLPIPSGAVLTRLTKGGLVRSNQVSWVLAEMASGQQLQLCATFTMNQAGDMPMTWQAKGRFAGPTETRCATRVVGIPAILLEVVDLEDPVEVGGTVAYLIKVTNQGSAPGTNIRIAAQLPDEQEFLSGSGATPLDGVGRRVTVQPLGTLAPGAESTWTVKARALAAGDTRFAVEMTSDQLGRSVDETEATRLY